MYVLIGNPASTVEVVTVEPARARRVSSCVQRISASVTTNGSVFLAESVPL